MCMPTFHNHSSGIAQNLMARGLLGLAGRGKEGHLPICQIIVHSLSLEW